MILPHELLCYLIAAGIKSLAENQTRLLLSKEHNKVKLDASHIAYFWNHWAQHFKAEHPACREGAHVPVGLSGDDARYTLAGSKLIVMMLSLPLQQIERRQACIPAWSNTVLNIP